MFVSLDASGCLSQSSDLRSALITPASLLSRLGLSPSRKRNPKVLALYYSVSIIVSGVSGLSVLSGLPGLSVLSILSGDSGVSLVSLVSLVSPLCLHRCRLTLVVK